MPTPIADPPIELQYFMQARSFLISDEYLRRAYDPQLAVDLSRASIVISAFSSELFMKCLLLMEGGGVPKIHDLDKLYGNLRKATRKAISIEWDKDNTSFEMILIFLENKKNTKLPRDLESFLRMGAKTFSNLRYPERSETHFFLDRLPRILERVILHRKPEWETVRRSRPTSHSR